MKPLATPADAERIVVAYLTTILASRGTDVTVGVVIPTEWQRGTKPHVQVALDGTPEVTYPALWRSTVRVTVWATATTDAKSLANVVLALLLSYGGDSDIHSIRPLTGVLPARDPATSAELASITVQVNLRGHVIA